MCIYYRQALDIALKHHLPWYIKPEMTIDALATHIAGGLLDMCPEEYDEELIALWYVYLAYEEEPDIIYHANRFLPH